MIPNCKQIKEQLNEKGLYKIYNGDTSEVGTQIKLKRSINEFSFLMICTGGVTSYTYKTEIVVPFMSQISFDGTLKPKWRTNDTICALTATGKITLKIIDENTLEINSTSGYEALRSVIGIIL